ncbi:MAG: PDZ domain-containing protein [Chloroflexota bacterium]|nr:PDZ domain-containing protein [Chloroflexota bacterium]
MRRDGIIIPIGQTHAAFGVSWVVMLPLALWGIATLYVPLVAPFLLLRDAWIVALMTVLLVAASLIAHVLAHSLFARRVGNALPEVVPLYPFGDATQVWSAAPTARHEVLVAVVGPLMNLMLAVIAYLLWDRQLHPYLNASTLFVLFFNAILVIVNLAPGFPLDGGRLARGIIWGLSERPEWGSSVGKWLGRLVVAILFLWGIALILLPARFSLQTGSSTILVATLLLRALWRHPTTYVWDRPQPARPIARGGTLLGTLVAALVIVGLLAASLSLLPTLNGLYLPGTAVPVEPMIAVPPEYHSQPDGTFLLTTVVAQTPITAGQWVYGRLSPVVAIVPPTYIVPPGTTPREVVQQSFRLLEESESVAVVVALQLAGYEAELTSVAVEVVDILPESPLQGVLQPGDLILQLNDEPTRSANDLIALVAEQETGAEVELLVERAGREMRLTTPLLPPTEPDGPPRLGIAVQSVGLDIDLPFPVRIEPQKVVGGPSAGLMFTLTTYNLLTPTDLTGGRRIAGTGTIELDGTVGPIGGVKQKVAAAERAGAEYFLVPVENYEDARDVATRIEVVPVATVQEALDFLRSLPGTLLDARLE